MSPRTDARAFAWVFVIVLLVYLRFGTQAIAATKNVSSANPAIQNRSRVVIHYVVTQASWYECWKDPLQGNYLRDKFVQKLTSGGLDVTDDKSKCKPLLSCREVVLREESGSATGTIVITPHLKSLGDPKLPEPDLTKPPINCDLKLIKIKRDYLVVNYVAGKVVLFDKNPEQFLH